MRNGAVVGAADWPSAVKAAEASALPSPSGLGSVERTLPVP